ncbi:MAG: polysaccharide deacetylase family protein [Planctomycetaceae bacterium]
MLSLFTILRGTPGKVGLKSGQVALTFDDGPNLRDQVTPRLLNVLHRHSVKAGFCVVGSQVRRHPEIVRRMYASGHQLINHTQHHAHPIRQNLQTLISEIDACEDELRKALRMPDYQSSCFRAPFGIVTPAVRRAVRRKQMTPVLLTHYAWDTRVGPQNFQPVVDLMIANARKHQGGLYVFHDGNLCPPLLPESDWSKSSENRSWIPDAVDHVIRTLTADGLKFVLPVPLQESADIRKVA